MDFFAPLFFLTIAAFFIRNAEQRQRIAWLSGLLGPLGLEKSMETLATGYHRALGESDPERSEPIWRLLQSSEASLVPKFQRLARDARNLNATQARVSRWALAWPLATRIFPAACFDVRLAMDIHAAGVERCVSNARGMPRKQQARQLLAELYLFQHTCHWYCRSRSVASTRLVLRHQTTYEQTLALVSRETREAYADLIAG